MNVQPDPTVIEMLVELACRAPSVHNSQPWKWSYEDGSLDLRTDRSRLLNTIDPSGRQLVISCGAALDHLKKAATAFKWSSEVSLLPTPGSPDHLAQIRFVHGAHPQSHDFDLLTAINRRRSDRRPLGSVPSTRAVTSNIREGVERFAVAVTVLSADAREALAEASRLSAGVRKYDATYQAELRWWAGHELNAQGIPSRALTERQDSTSVGVGRAFPQPRTREFAQPRTREFAQPRTTQASQAQSVVRDESSVVVLSTRSDSRLDWLRCGRALSSLLLESTAAGLATCSLSHMTEQPGSRALVESLAPAGGVPQVLVRIGVAQSPASTLPTPRLPVSSVLSSPQSRRNPR